MTSPCEKYTHSLNSNCLSQDYNKKHSRSLTHTHTLAHTHTHTHLLKHLNSDTPDTETGLFKG